MKINNIREMANLLFSFDWSGSIRIDLLVMEMIESISQLSPSLKEEYIDALADPNTKYHERFLREIENKIKQNADCPILSVSEGVDGNYIIRQVGPRGDLYSAAIEKINSFEKNGRNKGVWFEKFCIAFLADFGITCALTKNSNDKGIDIFGSYKSNVNGGIGKLIVNEDIYILGQAKYFSEKVDTPVIRKLVGDTIFIRFNELEYIEVKHNAVHLMVFSRTGFTEPAIEFARKNKIELFDQSRIAHLIANNPDVKWKCLNVGN